MQQQKAAGEVGVLGSAAIDHLQRPVLLTPALARLLLIVMMGAAVLTGQVSDALTFDGGPLSAAGELR